MIEIKRLNPYQHNIVSIITHIIFYYYSFRNASFQVDIPDGNWSHFLAYSSMMKLLHKSTTRNKYINVFDKNMTAVKCLIQSFPFRNTEINHFIALPGKYYGSPTDKTDFGGNCALYRNFLISVLYKCYT